MPQRTGRTPTTGAAGHPRSSRGVHLGLDADRVHDLERLHERLFLRVVRGVVGLVAAGEVRPDADHPQRTVLLGVGRGLDEPRPVGLGGSTPAEARCCLQLQPGPLAHGAGGGGDLVDLGGRVRGQVDARLDAGT